MLETWTRSAAAFAPGGRAAAQRWGFRQVEVYAPAEGRGCTLDVFTVDLEGDA